MNRQGLNGIKRLARAVIARAAADAGKWDAKHSCWAYPDARLFLSATDGEFARSRQAWCSIAEIAPDTLVRRSAAMLARPGVSA